MVSANWGWELGHGGWLMKAFLVLGAPQLKDRQRWIPDHKIADLQPRTERLHDLLAHVSVPASPLVMNRDDWVLVPKLQARSDDPIHLVLHLSIASLHSIEVETGLALVLHA